MKLVIEIPDHIYEHSKNGSEDSYDEWDAMRAIAKGFPYEERPHEKILVDDDGNTSCSRCGNTLAFGNFCCNCGADFREEKENEIH